jgi:hypothetical protein
MNGVVDGDAAIGEHGAQLPRLALGLGGGEAVAGDNDDLAGIRQLNGDIVDVGAADIGHAVRCRAGRSRVAHTKATDHDRHHRAVHRVRHQLGEDRAGRTHERARDDQDVVAEHKAGHCHG